MIIVTSRKNLWDSNHLLPEPDDKILDVDLDTMASNPVSMADLRTKVTNKKVLLLIHGYNNEPTDVTRAYRIIEKNHDQHMGHYDLILGYTWPGGDDPTDYFSAKNRAGAVSRRAQGLVKLLLKECSEVGIMTHSMGTRISLLICNDLEEEGFQRNARLIAYHMAAAVDNESVERNERYYEGSKFCDSSIIFHSKRDPVLDKIYRLAEWDRALGYSGPENPAEISDRMKIVNCKRRISAHGGYKRTPAIYAWIKSELRSGDTAQFSTLL